MDWLFGCFGAASNKARKHGDSQKVPSLLPFPVKVSPPSSIALKGSAVREEETHQDDLPQENQSSDGTLARQAESIPCQDSLEKTAEKKPNWSRLEDLGEEQDDLWKQTEEDSLDVKQIKEEVSFLKSCGTLLQTPAELRKNRPLETEQEITPLKGWHSWLVPSSPTLKLHFADPSHSQSAVKSVRINVTHHVQTPIFENTRKESDEQAAFSSILGQEKERAADSHFNFHDTKETQEDVSVQDSNNCIQDAIKLAKPINKTLVKGIPAIEEGNLLGSSKLDSPVILLGNETAILTCESFHSRLKRLEIPTATYAGKEAQEVSTNSGLIEQAHTLTDPQAPPSVNTANSRSRTAVLDAEGTARSIKHQYYTEESSNWSSYTVPESPLSSSGLTADSGEFLKPSLSTSSSNYQHCAGFEGIFHNKQDECSGGSRKKGFSYDRYVGYQLDSLESTASSSTKSEENWTDSCAENSLHENVPECNGKDDPEGFGVDETASVTLYSYGSTQHSVAQNAGRITNAARHGCKYDVSKDDNVSSDAISHASVDCTQTSRYKYTISHTAGVFRPEDQNFIETPFKVPQWIATPEFQRSPKVRSRPSSPVLTCVENTLQWKQLKTAKDNLEMGEHGDKYNCNAKASSKDHDFNRMKASTIRGRTGCTLAGMQEESWGENDHGVWINRSCPCVCKEGGEYGKQTKLAKSNVGLSQWLTPSPEQSRNCSLVSPTPLLRNDINMSHRFDAETASSLWTPMQANARGELMSHAPEALPIRVDMSLSNWLNASNKQDQGTHSKVTPAAFLRQGYHSGDPDERPILGVLGDTYSNSATEGEARWDGKGIPNTTSKYKEESRVSWHASPFEVRLERALINQGESLNEMRNEAALSTPVSKRLHNLRDL